MLQFVFLAKIIFSSTASTEVVKNSENLKLLKFFLLIPSWKFSTQKAELNEKSLSLSFLAHFIFMADILVFQIRDEQKLQINWKCKINICLLDSVLCIKNCTKTAAKSSFRDISTLSRIFIIHATELYCNDASPMILL